ncbi:MAG: rod shape-determining protein MreD [Spirochaetaceae bacterium]|jgi:rod shape-determining protein MreD|nr:rod shape-determining protein MreD [Spirochaetaceae bacterium]
MAKNIAGAVGFALLAAMLQSTLLRRLAVYHAVPDFVLVIIVFSAYSNGMMTGQLTGFFSGLMLDFLSAAPLGLNMLVRTLIGALAGLIKGAFYLDTVFLPMFLCAGATALKALILSGLHLLFTQGVPSYSFSGPMVWVELGFNTVFAPIIFGFLKLFKSLLISDRNI